MKYFFSKFDDWKTKIEDLHTTLEGWTHILEGNEDSIMCREPQSWYTISMFIGILLKQPCLDLEQYGGYRIILGRYLKNSLSILLINRKLGKLSNFLWQVVRSMHIASSRNTADCLIITIVYQRAWTFSAALFSTVMK